MKHLTYNFAQPNKRCKVSQEHSASLTEFEARGGEELRRYKLPAPGDQEVGPGLHYVAYVSVFLASTIICHLYKLTLSHQAQLLCNREADFPIYCKDLVPPFLEGEGG